MTSETQGVSKLWDALVEQMGRPYDEASWPPIGEAMAKQMHLYNDRMCVLKEGEKFIKITRIEPKTAGKPRLAGLVLSNEYLKLSAGNDREKSGRKCKSAAPKRG